jgi:hypothetical protein
LAKLIKPLACIGHKSLKIFDRCRLWQRNSPATPENSAAFWRGEFKTVCFRFLYFKTRLPDIRRDFLFGNIVILTLTWITNATARMIIDSKTSNDLPMKNVKKSTLFHLIIELTIYAAFVSVYLILVLHFLLDWLKELFTKQREVYAYVAILLMIGQAVGLERVTSILVHLTRRRTE